MERLKKLQRFVEREIWQINLSKVNGTRRNGIQLMRSFIIAWRDFKKDNCQLKASALTFYTLLSIVPVVAMLFGIAKGFGLEKRLESEFKSDLSYNQEMIAYVFDLANSMLENTKGGLIAGFGVIILFWSVMKVLSNIEQAFNDIWEVTTGRSWLRKFSDYMSLMLIAPVLTIISGSITVLISTKIQSAANSTEILGYFGPVLYFVLRMLPWILTILMFTVIYIMLPNTKVQPKSAFFGALFAGSIFLAVEWIYLSFQVGISKYNAIYGGFAALPLFLGWVQTNWLVVLLGAELSFAFQNQSKYEFEIESIEISSSYRFVLAIAVVQSLIQRFKVGTPGPTAAEISDGLQMPAKLVRRILNELVNCRVIAEVLGNNRELARYVPAIDINKLDVNFVLRRMNDFGINEIPVEKSEQMTKIEKTIKTLEEEYGNSAHNVLIKDL